MAKRIKVILPSLRSLAEVEDVLGEIRSRTIYINNQKAKLEKQRQRLDEEFLPGIAQATGAIEQLAERLQNWAKANPAEFAGKRSLCLTHGTLGWRKGQPTFKTLKGFTLDKVLEKIREIFANPDEFIRTSHEVNKQALIDQRATIPDEELKAIGVRITQAEPFFVEPKLDEPTETRIQEPKA
jgi:hypothetical protein